MKRDVVGRRLAVARGVEVVPLLDNHSPNVDRVLGDHARVIFSRQILIDDVERYIIAKNDDSLFAGVTTREIPRTKESKEA